MAVTVDATTEPVNLVWWHGDTNAQTFRFLSAPDTPMNLSEVTISAQARSTLGQLVPLDAHVSDDPADGVVTIRGDLTPDLYDYDIQFDQAGVISSWVHGRIRVKKDVTA